MRYGPLFVSYPPAHACLSPSPPHACVSLQVIYKSSHTGSEAFMYKFRADRGLTWEMALDKYKKEVSGTGRRRSAQDLTL